MSQMMNSIAFMPGVGQRFGIVLEGRWRGWMILTTVPDGQVSDTNWTIVARPTRQLLQSFLQHEDIELEQAAAITALLSDSQFPDDPRRGHGVH